MTVGVCVAGAICIAVVMVDVLWTTVAAGAGGGPFTTSFSAHGTARSSTDWTPPYGC
jgi:hypothetical protein